MKRLTKNNDTQYDFVGKYDTNIEEFTNNKELRNNVLNKLGELEDLEEEIGCPLKVVFKLAKQNELFYQFDKELQHHKNIKVDIKNGIVWYCKQVGGHYACQQPLSNYGKTFWLKEDKSE